MNLNRRGLECLWLLMPAVAIYLLTVLFLLQGAPYLAGEDGCRRDFPEKPLRLSGSLPASD